jgi:hypothetical protein
MCETLLNPKLDGFIFLGYPREIEVDGLAFLSGFTLQLDSLQPFS